MKCRVLFGLVIVVAATAQDIRLTRVASGIVAPTDIQNANDGISGACDVQYAGLAPGLVGVYQVNFRVPAGVSGPADLVVSAGGVDSAAVRFPVQ